MVYGNLQSSFWLCWMFEDTHGEDMKLFTVFREMDWELAYHETLNHLHHWFDLFRSLDPLANHSSDCRGDFN